MADPLRERTPLGAKIAGLGHFRANADLIITERTGLGLATVMLQGRTLELQSRIAELFSAALPDGPFCAASGTFTLVGVGPGAWLACQHGAASGWSADLALKLSGLASVSDQSSGYTVLRLEGPRARELLSKGAFIDFDPAAFAPRTASVTMIAHIGVIVWQADDASAFQVAFFRSYAASFWHWIEATSAAMGVTPTTKPEPAAGWVSSI